MDRTVRCKQIEFVFDNNRCPQDVAFCTWACSLVFPCSLSGGDIGRIPLILHGAEKDQVLPRDDGSRNSRVLPLPLNGAALDVKRIYVADAGWIARQVCPDQNHIAEDQRVAMEAGLLCAVLMDVICPDRFAGKTVQDVERTRAGPNYNILTHNCGSSEDSTLCVELPEPLALPVVSRQNEEENQQ